MPPPKISPKAETMSSALRKSCVGRPFEARVAVAVVSLALLLVGEDFVRFGGFLEPAFGLGVARVAVGVVLECVLAIRLS